MTGQMSEKPKRDGKRIRNVVIAIVIFVVTFAGGAIWARLSMPETIQPDRITEIELDTDADGSSDQEFNVMMVDISRSDITDNITLEFLVVIATPFP